VLISNNEKLVLSSSQSDVTYCPWILGRHPDFWDEPLKFNPDRWLGSSHNGGKPVPTVGTLPFIPFNYGPRTCLGIKMVSGEGGQAASD